MQTKRLSGQVGLILLVIMGLVVALVLSIASRSLSDTVLSRQERESSTAFALAETGVENALNLLVDNPDLTTESNLTDLQYKIAQSTSYNMYVKELEVAHLNMVGYNTLNALDIAWTKKNDANEDLPCGSEGTNGSAAAIEIAAFSSAGVVTRNYYKASNCGSFANGFAASSDGGSEYRSSISYTVPNNTEVIRIKPIYAGATIVISGSGLPKQQYIINSKATGGDAKKEIEVNRGLDAAPAVFDFAVFAGGTIVK